jgi:hypothetical protein
MVARLPSEPRRREERRITSAFLVHSSSAVTGPAASRAVLIIAVVPGALGQ